jgi:putative Holliday junction resolvase
MRYLAIDLGDKRTGLAVGDDVTNVVTPLEVVQQPVGPALIDAIGRVIASHEPDELVIGLPLNMDDTEGPRAKLVREFAASLHGAHPLPVHFQDERLTSYAADQQMARSGRTHKQKKQARDALAAAAILRDFLDGR